MPVIAKTAQKTPFDWPTGKRCAVTMTFDDGRNSAIEVGVPLLDRYGVKGTFYVMAHNVDKRLEDWQAAAANGHDMGNHTVTHPCSGNLAFARGAGNALEDFTLERMENELLEANALLEKQFGYTPVSFAYPCYHTFVGKGRERQSYVPLVAKHFITGRIGLNEFSADPSACDLAAVPSLSSDNATWEYMREAIEKAKETGSWIIFAGHEVGERAPHGVGTDDLAKLCEYCMDPANEIWIDTMAAVGKHVQENQKG